MKQLELLQGTNVNLDEFLPASLPNQRQDLQVKIFFVFFLDKTNS
jgi:hypothetical protein